MAREPGEGTMNNEYLKELDMGKVMIKRRDKRIKHAIIMCDQSRVAMWRLEGRKTYHYIFTIDLP